jgi:fucose 4-O-acetylase-like acetyltransferase
VGSLVVVVLGHWLMADVGPTGEVGNALAAVPALQVLTWPLQVMPLFFLVGGVAHAHALRSLRRRHPGRPGRYAAFVRARATRLLRPTLVLVAVWTGVGLLLHATGALDSPDGALLVTALRLVTQLLWFVGIYLGVAALAPAMHAAHRRWGLAAVAALAVGAVAVDVLRFTAGAATLATANFALVWLALHQLGFCWDSGLLTRRVAGLLAGGGLVAAVAAVAVGPYPVSMVGLPGEEISNMAPPTVALLAQGTAMVGVAVLARGPVTRLLARPRAWATVVLGGAVAMTAFLWHLTALFLAVLALRRVGVVPPEPASAAWWATRPVWLLLLAAVTAVLVAAFRRFEAPTPPSGPGRAGDGRLADAVAAVGAAACVLGTLMVSVTGVDVLGRVGVRFVVVDVTPAVALAVLAAGCLLLGVLSRPRPAGRR